MDGVVENDPGIVKVGVKGKVIEVVIGKTERMHKLYRDAVKAAQYRLPVLIRGETGSGKEWLASVIHSCGCEPCAPFLDVNCGAVTASLMESLFFGHEKGAFTGASQARDGYFSQVGSGTIFLDEIGELPVDLQPKLLRVLETGFFRPVGASQSIRFKGRIVAATHRDLEAMVKQGRFREDLFHRLNVLTLQIPSLKERKEDIPQLVDFFLSKSKKKVRLTDCAVNLLEAQQWSGNIRQLRNTIEKICVFSSEEVLNAVSIRSFLSNSVCCAEDELKQVVTKILDLNISNKMATVESLLIKEALKRYEGNKTRTAEELGLHRKALERRVKLMTTSVEALGASLKKIKKMQEDGAHVDVIEATDKCYRKSMHLSYCREVLDLRYEFLRIRCLSEREFYGWNAPCVMESYNEVVKLSWVLNDSGKLAFNLFGLWSVHLMNNELKEALVVAEQLQSLSVEMRCRSTKCKAVIALANTQFWMGRLEESTKNLDEFQVLYDQDLNTVKESGIDLLPLYLFLKGVVNCLSGRFNSAFAVVGKLKEYVEVNSHFFSQVVSYQALMIIEFFFSHHEKSNSYALKLIELTEMMEYRLYHGLGLVFHGAYINRYCREKGAAIMAQGISECRGTGEVFMPFYSLIRSKILMEAETVQLALKQLDEGIDFAVSGENYAFYPELLFLQSVSMATLGMDGYKNGLRKAYGLVKAQGNKFAQLRILYFCLKKRLKVAALCFDEGTFYDEAELFLGGFPEDEHHPLLDYVRFRVGWGMRVDL